jgi:hypothetical protein
MRGKEFAEPGLKPEHKFMSSVGSLQRLSKGKMPCKREGRDKFEPFVRSFEARLLSLLNQSKTVGARPRLLN